MRNITKAAFAVILSTTAFGGALAADAIGLPPVVAPIAPVYDNGAFDWNGFYAGASVGGANTVENTTTGAVNETNWAVGAQVGVNTQFDMFVLGAELAVEGIFANETTAYGSALVRGGVVVTDDLLAYATVGYGSDFGDANGAGEHILAGAGLEYAVTEAVSVRGQYLYGWEQTSVATKGDAHKFSIGANFHF